MGRIVLNYEEWLKELESIEDISPANEASRTKLLENERDSETFTARYQTL